MYARVTTIHAQPGTTEEGIHIFESVTPQLKSESFVSTQLLIDRTANTALVVALYETLEDLEAGTTLFRQVLGTSRVAALSAGPPDVAIYEVAVQLAAQP